MRSAKARPVAPRAGKEGGRKLYLESYGCQMNFSDSEIVASILAEAGFSTTQREEEADLILLNTCSIRDNAEQRIRHRLQHLKGGKRKNPKLKVGILGCMAERLRDQLLEEEKLVDMVVGPDAYRDLPRLVDESGGRTESGQYAAEPRRDLRGDPARAPRRQGGYGVHFHHARLRQHVQLLRGAIYPGP